MPVPLTSASNCCNNYGIKARDGTIFHNCENLMMGAPGKGDKRHIPRAMTSSYDQIACYVIYLTKSRVSIPLQPRSLGRLKSLNIIIIIKLHLSQVQFNNNNNIINHNSKLYL